MLFFVILLILLYVNAKLNFNYLSKDDNIEICRQKLYIQFEENYPELDFSKHKELAFRFYLATFFVLVFGLPIVGHFVLRRFRNV